MPFVQRRSIHIRSNLMGLLHKTARKPSIWPWHIVESGRQQGALHDYRVQFAISMNADARCTCLHIIGESRVMHHIAISFFTIMCKRLKNLEEILSNLSFQNEEKQILCMLTEVRFWKAIRCHTINLFRKKFLDLLYKVYKVLYVPQSW